MIVRNHGKLIARNVIVAPEYEVAEVNIRLKELLAESSVIKSDGRVFR